MMDADRAELVRPARRVAGAKAEAPVRRARATRTRAQGGVEEEDLMTITA